MSANGILHKETDNPACRRGWTSSLQERMDLLQDRGRGGCVFGSYHPAWGAGAHPSHVMARSTVLTGTTLLTLGAMVTIRTGFTTAEGEKKRGEREIERDRKSVV